MAKTKLTLPQADALSRQKGYNFRSSVDLLKWLFEGRVVRTVDGAPPDKRGNAPIFDITDDEIDALLVGVDPEEIERIKQDIHNGVWPQKLATPRKIALTVDVAGEAMFDGSQDIQIGTVVNRLTNLEIEELFNSVTALGG